MARKTKIVTLGPDAGRDQNRSFFITEMPPRKGEDWARRAILLVAQGKGADARTAQEVVEQGMGGLVTVGLQAFLGMDGDLQKPLADEMLECVMFIPDLARIDQNTLKPHVRPVDWDTDVDEIATIGRLRSEVIEIHTGFSPAAFLSNLGKAVTEAKVTSKSPPTPTSRKRSRSSSGKSSPR